MCVGGVPCIFGVLTVNLLTPSLFFPVSMLCGAQVIELQGKKL